MGLPIKFEMQSPMTDVSTSDFNSSLNIAAQGSVEQQQYVLGHKANLKELLESKELAT
jgi:hypothetical protein